MYGSPDKIAELQALATVRQKEAWPGYYNIADFHGGIYESLHVSPYTRGAGNCDSPIFLLLQDWCSEDDIKGFNEEDRAEVVRLGRASKKATNPILIDLVHIHLKMDINECYATNLFPFIKTGGTSNNVPPKDLRDAAKVFAIPQIKVVKPKHVICLGAIVFKSIRQALGLPSTLTLGSQVGKWFDWDGVRIWSQAHPARRPQKGRSSWDLQNKAWLEMVESVDFRI